MSRSEGRSWLGAGRSADEREHPWVETVGVGLGLLYGVGFLSERSAHAYLGIWSHLPLLSERYAQSGGLFLLSLLEVLFFPIGFLGLTSILLIRMLPHPTLLGRWREPWTGRIRGSIEAAGRHAPWIYLGIALILTKVVETLFRERISSFGVLLESEQRRADLGSLGWTGHFTLLVAVVLISLFLCWRLRHPRFDWPVAHPWLRAYLWVLLALQLLLLPIHHGRVLAGQSAVPIAEIRWQEADPIETPAKVALLFQNEHELVTWDGHTIHHRPRERIRSLAIRCFRTLDKIPFVPIPSTDRPSYCQESQNVEVSPPDPLPDPARLHSVGPSSGPAGAEAQTRR